MEKKRFYKQLVENLYDGIYFVDINRKIWFWNKGAERISGYKKEEVVNSFCYKNILNHVDTKGNELCLNGCPLLETIKDGKVRDALVFLRHKEGYRVPVTIKTIPIEENNEIIGAIEIFQDASNDNVFLDNIDNLKELALKDPLTGLPNRRYIDTYLISRKNELKYLNVPYGIIFMDIDDFKRFNDSYGHDFGDQVLKMISKVFTNVIRSNDLIGRWGGEEFLGVFSGASEESLDIVANKIRILVENSYIKHDNKRLQVTISIGATMVKKDEALEEAIKRSDELLYLSKSEGKNKVSIG